jgi:hypothetical protein
MINNTMLLPPKFKRIANTNTKEIARDIANTNITILYYSIIFSLITSHIINNKFKNEQEQNIYIIETTILMFCLCKMELVRLL